MKRFPIPRALAVILLLGLLIVLVPANVVLAESKARLNTHRTKDFGPETQEKIANCLGNISIGVVGTLLSEGELGFAALSPSVPICVSAVISALEPPTPQPTQPKVDILTPASRGAFSGSVQSALVGNCTDYPRNMQFNFYVPFQMSVGANSESNFNTSPGGSSDNELIAQELFGHNMSDVSTVGAGNPSLSSVYSVPPHRQIVINLPITVNYEAGEAHVVHSDGTTANAPWLFTTSYMQNGPITPSVVYC